MSTVSLSPCSQVPANASPAENKTSVDSSATVKYEDLVRCPDIFWDKLKAMLECPGKPLKFPRMGGSTLDLHRLFVEVTSRGGMAKVIKERRWREVIVGFNFPPTTTTNASFVLRRYYLKFLYHLEHVYYLHKPASSIQSAEEAMKSLSPNLEEGTDDPEIGLPVRGVIDGKFESGYLVTMKLGSQKLKGVLYHLVETPSQDQHTMEAPSAMAPSSPRRDEKKAKLAVVDSQETKCYRSGYNFFFAEQYARLKPEYHGKERAITRLIGNMWGSLSESEKQVYEDKGEKDVERYRTEMQEYKAAHESGASASA